MNKKEIKKQKYCLMENFLISYIGISDRDLIEELLQLNHKEFKEKCLTLGINLTCIPFEIVTKEDIEIGNILLVCDKKGHIAPYKNPIKANFNTIMDEEVEREIQRIYSLENHMQSFDEYTDELDEVALDENFSSQKIKVLSQKKYKGSGK